MSESIVPKLPKWPFFLGDLLLIAGAVLICFRTSLPLGLWEGTLIAVSIAAGALLAILPFILEYRVVVRLVEAERLAEVVGQVRQMETIAEQISSATARWQGVQEVADRVAGTSKAIAERMSTEAKSFAEFLQRANDSEKANLRLETEKLRRAEGEWIQALVRMLDHVYALHVAGARSGQPKLMAQLDQFQLACRDAARRIGLAPFTAEPAERFDAQRHQLFEPDQSAPDGATVSETVATGYTFQGRLLRPALVRLQGTNGNGHGQSELPLPQNQQA